MNAMELAAFPVEASPRPVSGQGVRGRTRRVTRHRSPNMGDFGLSLKPSRKIKAAAKKVGKVITSKPFAAIGAGALALTGVGAPAAAAIMGGTRATGKALQGAKLKGIVKSGASGAVIGAGASIAGKGLVKVPKLGAKVIKFRQKIGTAPRTPAPSYDSDKRLDALATGTLPEPTLVSSGPTMPVLQPITAPPLPVTGAVTDSVTPAIADKIAAVNDAQRARARRRSAAARILDIGKRAAETASAITTEPSANASAPTGGFPAVPATMSPTDPTGEQPNVQNAGMGAGLFSNPILLVAAAGFLFLTMNKGR